MSRIGGWAIAAVVLAILGCTGTETAPPVVTDPAATAPSSELPPREGKAKGRKARADLYDDTKPAVCDALAGDLQVACFNGATGVITCKDYPGDLGLACEAGQFDPNNGRWFKNPPEGAVP